MNEITAKRLAVVRMLFEKGKALSFEGDPMNGLCLLPFHDSVEMFLKLCADEKGITVPRDATFLSYFDKMPEMQDKTQMASLNSRRVSLKHHGQLPSNLDVEASRVNVMDFFDHNTPTFFGCQLDDVSLEVLIEFPEVRKYLALFHEFKKEGKFGDAQAQCQIAFHALLVSYHRKYDRQLSLLYGSGRGGVEWLQNPYLYKKMDDYLEKLRDAIKSINEAISIMNLGINYYSFKSFLAKGPSVIRLTVESEDRYDYRVSNNSPLYSEETANECYQFVIETALKLQKSNVFLR